LHNNALAADSKPLRLKRVVIDKCYDTEISTFLSIVMVIIKKSFAPKVHITIRILSHRLIAVLGYH